MSNLNENKPVEKQGFTPIERIIFSLFVLIILALIIGTAVYFMPASAPEQEIDILPSEEIPMLSPAVVEKVSNGEVFLKYFNDGKFEKFSESEEPRFDNTLPTVVFIHGMGGSTDTNWIKELASRIRKLEPNTNIIAVDWSFSHKLTADGPDNQLKNVAIDMVVSTVEESDTSGWIRWGGKIFKFKDVAKKSVDILLMPVETANKIPDVVNMSNDCLFDESGLHLAPEQTRIIGFSHGSHIAGMIGMKQLGKIKHITVLDPSTRAVHLKPGNVWGNGWDNNAAQFIDMYASSKWAGTSKIYGTKNFFVQEKTEDTPPWWDISKSAVFTTVEDHMYAAKWFLSTIGNIDDRFGYSISTDSVPEESWQTIFSTLPKKGELDGIDKPITNGNF